jgi:hypothetical protein
MASAMSSGDSISRSWAPPVSSQRTAPTSAGCHETLGARHPGLCAFVQPHEVGPEFAHGVQALCRGAQGGQHAVQRLLPFDRGQPFRRGLVPVDAVRSAALARHQPQFTRRMFHAGHQLLPVDQAARLLQPGGQCVAREIEQLPGAQMQAEELHAGLVELVRLVEDGDAHRGQQFGHARFAHGQVGEHQMVVHHHHIGRQRLAPRQVDVALLVLRALRAQAVVAGGGDQRDQRRAFVQVGQLGQIAAARAARPLLDAGQAQQRGAVAQVHVPARPLEAVQADITGAALEQGRAQRQLQRAQQLGQVAAEELVLQGLGGGGQQHPFAAEQGRHQVGEGLAHARAGFDDQHAAGFDGFADGRGHVDLALARRVGGAAVRQHTIGGKHLFDARQQRRTQGQVCGHHAGSLGSRTSDRRAIWSRSASGAS